jgi:hypothetical protein
MAKLGDLPFPMRASNTWNYLSIRIPRLKCIHYAFNAQGSFGNPYGRSLLRRAYKFWVMKDAFLQMLAVALDRKGTPLGVVWADGNAIVKDPTKTGGQGKTARGEHGKGISAAAAARDAFANVHNDSVIVLPGKKGQIFDAEFMDQQSNADVFIASINLCNASIMRALLIPSLIFTNGDGTGSYALGQEHAKTFDKILDSWLEGFKAVLLEQLIKEIIAYNFPREVWQQHGLGNFGKRELTQDERQKEAEMFATACTAGIVDQNDLGDLNKMRETLGFEARTTPILKPVAPPMPGAFGDEGEDDDEDETDGPSAADAPEEGDEGNFGGDQNRRPPKAGAGGPGVPGGRGSAGDSTPARTNRARAKGKKSGGAAKKPGRVSRRQGRG